MKSDKESVDSFLYLLEPILFWPSGCGGFYAVHQQGESQSVAGTRIMYLRSPRVAALAPPTMGFNSTSSSSSILKDGELKPGIYKIQNIYTETFLDIHVHSREVCCRPVKDLGEGRGLVSRCLSSMLHVSDGEKWEIKRFGAGYTVQVVSAPVLLDLTFPPYAEER
jgi:hypothetical protein